MVSKIPAPAGGPGSDIKLGITIGGQKLGAGRFLIPGAGRGPTFSVPKIACFFFNSECQQVWENIRNEKKIGFSHSFLCKSTKLMKTNRGEILCQAIGGALYTRVSKILTFWVNRSRPASILGSISLAYTSKGCTPVPNAYTISQ